MRYVAAFRTHTWDDDIAELARRFFAAAPSSRKVVLVDETRGPIDIPGYEKISHTDDTQCFGLPNYPAGFSLWFNGDYAVYFLRRALPEFDYYLVSESDLAVNLSLEPMMRFATTTRVDVIAHRVQPSQPRWAWHHHGLALSDAPWQALLFLAVFSARAIDCLLDARQQLARRLAAGEVRQWPFCEAFVPTVLKSISDMRIVEVSRFANSENLVFRPWISIHDPRANRTGTLVHPVLGGKSFIIRLLAKYPVHDFFCEGSELREGLLNQTPHEDIVEPLRRVLAKQRDHAGVAQLYKEAAEHGWPIGASDDLAFCKPAVTSSVSPWSWSRDPERDACGANGELLANDYGFHTQEETDPWWMVDLLREHLIEEVTIVNRRAQQRRFRTFRIDSSLDGAAWTTRLRQADPIDVSADPAWPWRVTFPDPFTARYLRIVVEGRGILHLRRVQIFGPGPVSGRRLIGRQLATHPLREFFREGSELREALLSQAPHEDIVEPLRQALARERDHAGIALLAQEAAKYGWPWGLPSEDLALCKPARSSSVSRWSRYPDPDRDACGANGEQLADDFGFHTGLDVDPWWMVDLLGEHLIEEVAIVNRASQQQRFRSFRIESSLDGASWTTRFTQAGEKDISSDPEQPWRAAFAEPFAARHVRIVQAGTGVMHLRRVQVFGCVLPQSAADLRRPPEYAGRATTTPDA